MSTIAVAARPPSVAILGMPAERQALPPIGLSQGRLWWTRLTYWPAELVRLVALIYLLPVAIYAVCTPIALLVNAVRLLTGSPWKSLWN